MNDPQNHRLNRRDLLNIAGLTLLGLAFPAGLREEFGILEEHNSNRTKTYPLTDTVIKTKTGNEVRILGVLHTARGLARSKQHIEKAVLESDVILTENTDLVGVQLEYFNDLAKFAKEHGKKVIDVDRFSKEFRDGMAYAYSASTLLYYASIGLAGSAKKRDLPQLASLSEKLQPILFSTASLALLTTHYSPIRNYGPRSLDISFEATTRSLAMYCHALNLADEHRDQKLILFCGEGHARDMIKFHSEGEDKSKSKLLTLYKPFLSEPVADL